MDEEQKNVEVQSANTNASNTPNERKGFNVSALVLGIISIVSFFYWYAALPAGIIAIIFGIAGRKDAGRGMGITGIILGIIGLVICTIKAVV